jgi:hypothetical protein
VSGNSPSSNEVPREGALERCDKELEVDP